MVSHLNIFVWKLSKIAAQKKRFIFVADFALQNMVETTLSDGLMTSGQRGIANFGISLDVFEFFRFGLFFPFKK